MLLWPPSRSILLRRKIEGPPFQNRFLLNGTCCPPQASTSAMNILLLHMTHYKSDPDPGIARFTGLQGQHPLDCVVNGRSDIHTARRVMKRWKYTHINIWHYPSSRGRCRSRSWYGWSCSCRRRLRLDKCRRRLHHRHWRRKSERLWCGRRRKAGET